MLAYTYVKENTFSLIEKQKPVLMDDRDAIVRVTLSSICTSDLHIKQSAPATCTSSMARFPGQFLVSQLGTRW